MKEAVFTEVTLDTYFHCNRLVDYMSKIFIYASFFFGQRPRPRRLWGPLVPLDHLHPFAKPSKPYAGKLILNLHLLYQYF
jgi:hypothetical protein